MAYLTIMRMEGDSAALMDAEEKISAVVSPVAKANGAIVHIAAPTEDGMVMINLWESQSGSEQTAADPDVKAAIDEHAIAPPRFEHCDLARYELGD